jgi:hypothetical protein
MPRAWWWTAWTATCPPQDTFDFFFAKSYHGLKDVAVHFLVDAYDREKAREAAYAAFNNNQVPEMPSQFAAYALQAGRHAGPPLGGVCPERAMKKNASTVTMTWFTRSAAW